MQGGANTCYSLSRVHPKSVFLLVRDSYTGGADGVLKVLHAREALSKNTQSYSQRPTANVRFQCGKKPRLKTLTKKKRLLLLNAKLKRDCTK